MHATLLGIKRGMRIADIGCGTGDFTRYLAELTNGKCTIIGVDNRTANLRTAERETEKAGLDAKISFREGDAYKIPIEDGWADLTCCRTLLMHLTDHLKAVREMTRVTREGGVVAAIEPAFLASMYVPDDERMSKLAVRLQEAYVEGVRKREGKTFNIGERLPTIFRKAGLSGIMAEVQADAYLTTDPRRSTRDVRDEVQFYLADFKQTKKLDSRSMLAGGASKTDINKYNRWVENHARQLLRDTDKLRHDTLVSASGMYVVAGRKTG